MGNHWILVQYDFKLCYNIIESFNTLLDDNKVLCLESHERIPLPENTKICWVAANCDDFSPAFVSRCGIVNLNN